jgi:uncharacterized C2H2 Zn-finger protein
MHKADKENLYCTTCGEQFRSKAKLARHIVKWNNSTLREKLLTR